MWEGLAQKTEVRTEAASATKISAEMFFTAIGENACSVLGAIESVAGAVKAEEA